MTILYVIITTESVDLDEQSDHLVLAWHQTTHEDEMTTNDRTTQNNENCRVSTKCYVTGILLQENSV